MDRKEEAGAGNYTHCPKAAHAVAMAASRGARRAAREPVPPRVKTRSWWFAQGGLRCCEDDGKRSEGRNLTGDHLLGVVRLHVAVVLPESLSLPLLSALLSIEGVRVILHNHHLHEEMRFYKTPVQFLGLSIGC